MEWAFLWGGSTVVELGGLKQDTYCPWALSSLPVSHLGLLIPLLSTKMCLFSQILPCRVKWTNFSPIFIFPLSHQSQGWHQLHAMIQEGIFHIFYLHLINSPKL